MIHRISESIAFFCGEKTRFSKEQIEICAYGLEVLLSDFIVIFIAILIACLVNALTYTVLILLTFILLRSQTGGFHASSHFRCNLIFFVAYALAILAIKYIPDVAIIYSVVILGMIALLAVLRYSPLEHPNKPISKNKMKKYRKMGVIVAVFFYMLSILLSILLPSIQRYALSIAIGMFYVGISIIAEIYKRKPNDN